MTIMIIIIIITHSSGDQSPLLLIIIIIPSMAAKSQSKIKTTIRETINYAKKYAAAVLDTGDASPVAYFIA
jgi:hypothetical protein